MHDPKRLVAQGYDTIADRYTVWAQRVRAKERARYTQMLYEMLPVHAALLELGCGAGLPTTRTLAQHFHVIDVDISGQQLARAKRHVPTVTFPHADAHFRHQLPHTGPDFAALWKQGAAQHMAAFLTGAISFTEQRRHRIRAVFPAPLEDHEADRLFRIYLASYEQSWSAFPDVLPCLDRLTAHTLGILSHGNTQHQRKKLESFGIAARFSVVVTSEAVGVAKPDPRLFTLACHAAAAHPTQCVYVGDRLETDAHAAHQAGWTGIWLNRTASEMVPSEGSSHQ